MMASDSTPAVSDNKIATSEAADIPYQEPGLPRDGTGADATVGMNDAAIIPKGEIDPVYEAKARILNRAARCESMSGTRLASKRD